MELQPQIRFGPLRFDRTTQRLWQGEQEIRLRARTRAVLQYLVEHPWRVIPRQEFEQHLWGRTHVTQSVLRVCIWELRQALGDSEATPQYIETVGQQGYRFCATTWRSGAATSLETPFVGRQAELHALQTALEHAQRGTLQLVFISGDPGIGKTALVRQFLSQVPTTPPLWISSGQCIEHVGSGEAYLPLLEALGRLGREPESASLVATLRRTAPMWLAHLSQLVEPDELDGLRRQVQGMQSERMLREVAEALTVITQETLVVLVLEDLQWSDSATVETLSYLARRPEPLRLLVIGTYRPAEVIVHGHPLRQTVQELMAHRLCQELPLELLTQEQVQAYVTQRLGSRSATSELGAMIYRRTEGNALFTVHLLDHLLQQGWLVDAEGQWRLRDGVEAVNREVPEGLRALLLKQMENLDVPAQQVLAAASVNGMRFTIAEVAAVLPRGVEKVEAICDALTRQSAFIAAQALVTWPDGTVTARYGFRHVMFSEVFYEQLGMAQRARWHRLVGERLESGYGIRARELAGVLSLHFERGQDVRRAVQYQQYGAEQALSRHAYTEAMGHCQRGLELLAPLPESPERATQELGLRLALSNALTATQGYTSEALVDNLHRALALCQAAEAATEQVRVLVGLTRVFMMRADRAATERLMARERMLLSQLDDATSLVQLHMQLGTTETFRGAYAQAQVHLSHLLNLYDPEVHQSLASAAMIVTALAWSGWCLWLTGYPDQADEQVSRAQAHAEALTHPFSLAFALNFVALVRLGRGEFQAAVAAAQEFTTLAREYGFAFFEAMGTMLQGSALAHGGDLERGMSLLTTGLAQYRHLGCQAFLPFFLTCLAETHLRRDQVEEGLSVIREAVQLTWTNFDRFWAPEVYRLRGDLLLAQAGQARLAASLETATAEACLQQALDMARQQGAKALELRAAMSLSRLWLAQDKPDAAQEVVAELYNGFTEGLDTADLQTAKDLLEHCRYTPESRGRPHLF